MGSPDGVGNVVPLPTRRPRRGRRVQALKKGAASLKSYRRHRSERWESSLQSTVLLVIVLIMAALVVRQLLMPRGVQMRLVPQEGMTP